MEIIKISKKSKSSKAGPSNKQYFTYKDKIHIPESQSLGSMVRIDIKDVSMEVEGFNFIFEETLGNSDGNEAKEKSTDQCFSGHFDIICNNLLNYQIRSLYLQFFG